LVNSEPSALEVSEHLEQLRALSLGMIIAVGVPVERPGIGVDTEEDLSRASEELSENSSA
jgi:CMP-2-keto-3-deoxyoctulosonic acid synthetase